MTKELREIMGVIKPLRTQGDLTVKISRICYDSRRVQPGALFVCMKGLRADGHDFIPEAVARGAIAVVVEREVPVPAGIPLIQVQDSRSILGPLAAAFYDYPSRHLGLIGVTGTNGKTTTTYLLKSVLERIGHQVGLIGTIRNLIGERELPAERTTPEASDLQELLAKMRDEGVDWVVMEVSSHAVAMNRILGCEFDAAVFTNLSQDHLDFHGTFTEYRLAKTRFLAGLGEGGAYAGSKKHGLVALNADDPSMSFIREKINPHAVKVVTYGLEKAADYRGEQVDPTMHGLRMRVACSEGTVDLNLRLTGLFNAYNTLGAFAVLHQLGIQVAKIKEGLEMVRGVPGRLELIDEGQDFAVVVDYAHTPDGLENILKAVKGFKPRRVLLVFGCGGDRDRTKRPIMGEIAARYADWVYITSDNPRSEEPAAICEEIVAGIEERGKYEVIVDRREAIRRAIMAARAGDVVVIAGKGHETYQIFKDRTIHFDDREEAREALKMRLAGGKSV